MLLPWTYTFGAAWMRAERHGTAAASRAAGLKYHVKLLTRQ
jgi:hypothetical protein